MNLEDSNSTNKGDLSKLRVQLMKLKKLQSFDAKTLAMNFSSLNKTVSRAL